MDKFVIGCKIHGYTTVEAASFDVGDSAVELTVVLSESKVDLKQYYTIIESVLSRFGRVLLIGVKGCNEKDFKALASLCVSHRCYDVYRVLSKDLITAKYLTTIEDSSPDISDVMSFIGGDVIAYSNLSTLMIGIETLSQDGDFEGLKKLFKQHAPVLEELTCTLDYMKTACEQLNIQETTTKINDLKGSLERYKKDLDSVSEELKTSENSKKEIREKLELVTKEADTLKSKISDLKQEKSSTNVFKTYNTVKTSTVDCKVSKIIYFKEVSYVRYTNSFVKAFIEMLSKTLKLKCKLVIYDNRTSFSKMYDSMKFVNGREFNANKASVLDSPSIVITEPLTVITTDILSSDNFDIVIIYDRMKETSPIVSGTQVVPLFIVNSKNDLLAVKDDLKITVPNRVITSPDTKFTDATLYSNDEEDPLYEFQTSALNLETIQGFKDSSESYKTTTYCRVVSSRGEQKSLFGFLMDICGIERK